MSSDLTRTVRHARHAMARAAVQKASAKTLRAAHKADRRERAGRRSLLEALRLSDLVEG